MAFRLACFHCLFPVISFFPKETPTIQLPSPDCKRASLFGPNSSYCISAAFSFPFGSLQQRGYILYETQLPDLQSVYLMSFNYYHSGHPFHIPYRRMDQALMKGASGGIGTRQMQHYSTCWTEDFTVSPAETDAVLSPAPPEV